MPALPPDRPEGGPAGRRRTSARHDPLRARPGCPPGTARPLPDPAAVRMFLVPESAPPYDDETGTGARRPAPGAVRGGRPADGGARAGTGERAGGDEPRGADRPGRATPPPSAQWPGQFAQVLVETLAGVRPARQMAPWATEHVRERIARLGPQLLASQRPRVLRVITARPTPAAVEMTVLLGVGPRVRALAVRLERDRPDRAGKDGSPAGWRCTAVEAA